MTLVLASTSAGRRAMLTAAGVAYEAVAPHVDEDAAKQAFAAQTLDGRPLDGRALADALAELKAVKVSIARPMDLVIGCDQTLELEDGGLLEKPGPHLAAHLRLLSGRTHVLHSAAVVAEGGRPIWRFVGRAKLTMRRLSDTFIDDYVSRETQAAGCVGGYRIEGLGAQLFSRIEGDQFTIVGLPLLALLDWLRLRGVLAS